MAVPFATVEQDDTILSIVNDAAGILAQPALTTLNSSSKDVRRWIAAARFIGKEVRRRGTWPQLKKRYTFTTDSTGLQLLPIDFDKHLYDTFWETGQYRKVIGSLSERGFEAQKNSVETTLPYLQYRIGAPNHTIHFVEAQASRALVFPFQSLNWLLPEKEWAASISVTSGEYVFYGENVFQAQATGTTGSDDTNLVLTNSRGNLSDGTINWKYVKYDTVVEDNATPILPRNLLVNGIAWKWAQINGLEYQDMEAAWNWELQDEQAQVAGSGQFLIGGGKEHRFIEPHDISQEVEEY